MANCAKHTYFCQIFLAFLLFGCSTIHPPALQSVSQEDLNCFDANGRMSIIGPETRSQVNFTWHQLHENYDILLSGPLGISAAHIWGNETTVHLVQGDTMLTHQDPEHLLAQQLKIRFPIKNAPLIMKKALTETQFQQAGWNVQILKRFDNNLPKIMTLSVPHFSVKAVFTDFQSCRSQNPALK